MDEQLLHDLVDVDRPPVVDLREDLVLQVEGALDLLAKDLLVEQVLHPDADAVHLVGVRRADPRPVVPILRGPRNRSVTLSRVRWYSVMRWALALSSSRDVSIPRASRRVELLDEDAEVDHDAVADHRDAARGEDAAGEQVEGELLVADDDRVAGVVATVELHDVADSSTEQVGRLAFALVAPLGADDHDRGHVRTFHHLDAAVPGT